MFDDSATNRNVSKNGDQISKADLKQYPHFDAPLPISEIKKIVNDPIRVAKNDFFPFLRYFNEWQPYRKPDQVKPEKKRRPIRFASRKDAYIFTHYRRILAEKYESRLKTLGIQDVPVAYRKLATSTGTGKCNIDFAKQAFDKVTKLGDCVGIALDIKSYFESLDHKVIKKVWCELLGTKTLPADHYSVFKNITRYRYCDLKEVHRRLGYIESNENDSGPQESYVVPFSEMPKQLCTPKDFREKICGKHPDYESIVECNDLPYGIPQGAPISDLIANFYLIEFDTWLNDYANSLGGLYLRYSDDILLVLPQKVETALEVAKVISNEIGKHGTELKIKESKTCIVRYYHDDSSALKFEHIRGPQGHNGLEYLGFRFDGKHAFIRESTISRLHRKIAKAAKREAKRLAKENPDVDAAKLFSSVNFSAIEERYGKVRNTELTDDYKTWTFYSYVKRSSEIFGPMGSKILKQMSSFRAKLHARFEKAIFRAVEKRDASAGSG